MPVRVEVFLQMDHDRVTPRNPEPRPFGLKHDEWGKLVLIDADGVRHAGVEPVRGFPISDPDHWVSICDAEGREVACIEDIDALPEPMRTVLEADLAMREFVPIIQRIVRVSADTSPSEWEVETDRGSTRFTVNAEDDVRRLGPDRALVVDTQGLRYLIPDMRTLDGHGRRLLERYF